MDFNWMKAVKAPTTTVRVMNLDQADTIVKMAANEPYVVELDTYDHKGESIGDWVWSADYIRSLKWTVSKGWDYPNDGDDYGALHFVASRKGRRHILTIHKSGWDWSCRLLGTKYWN